MKKYLSSLVILVSFVMYSFTGFASCIKANNTPVILQLRKAPWIVGNPNPTKSDPNSTPPVCVYLNEESNNLLLYSSSVHSVTYYIYDADEMEVSNGSVSFSEHGDTSIYVGTLNEGTYTIYIVVNNIVYGGEFQI